MQLSDFKLAAHTFGCCDHFCRQHWFTQSFELDGHTECECWEQRVTRWSYGLLCLLKYSLWLPTSDELLSSICICIYERLACVHIFETVLVIIPPEQRSCWGVYWFHSIRLSVRPSVRLSRLPYPLCNIYSSGWILSILATNDDYYERVCCTQWPLTLTYIFKVIRPWLRKSCPLCSVYSSGWILFIFKTNHLYH